MALILKIGSKGKWVQMLQKFLNLKGKIPEKIEETGSFDYETKVAVQCFQKTFKLKVETKGIVGPETARALGKLVGSQAAAFVKEFDEPEDKKADADAEKKKAEDQKSSSGGEPGRHGNTFYESGGYVISMPPKPAGTFPLLVLFAGTSHIKAVLNAPSASYFKNAIVVFGEMSGSFAGAKSALNALLKENGASIGSISICGYSGGAPAAMAAYSNATKAVGLIDPSLYFPNFAKFNGKTILSVNTSSPESWNWSARDPKRSDYTVGQARADAVALVKKAGGVAEVTSTGHGAYPKYFLGKFESKLI